MNDIYIEAVSGILKSMSHPIRMKILYKLLEEDQTTGELLKLVQTTNPNLSQHLNILRDNGLITSKKTGTYIHNSIADKRIAKILMDIKSLFQPGASSDR